MPGAGNPNSGGGVKKRRRGMLAEIGTNRKDDRLGEFTNQNVQYCREGLQRDCLRAHRHVVPRRAHAMVDPGVPGLHRLQRLAIPPALLPRPDQPAPPERRSEED